MTNTLKSLAKTLNDQKLSSWAAIASRHPMLSIPDYDNQLELHPYLLKLTYFSINKNSSLKEERQYFRIRFTSLWKQKQLFTCLGPASILQEKKGRMESQETQQFYLMTRSTRTLGLRLICQVQRLSFRTSQVDSQIIGWFSIDPLSVDAKSPIIPFKGNYLSYKFTGKQERDSSLFNLQLLSLYSKNFSQAGRLIVPEKLFSWEETIPGLSGLRLPKSGQVSNNQAIYTVNFQNMQIEVPEMCFGEATKAISQGYKCRFVNQTLSHQIKPLLRLYSHNGVVAVSTREVWLENPAIMIRNQKKYHNFRIEEKELFRCVISQQAVFAVELLVRVQTKIMQAAQSFVEIKFYSLAVLLLQSSEENLEVSQEFRYSLYGTSQLLRLNHKMPSAKAKFKLISIRNKADRFFKTEVEIQLPQKTQPKNSLQAVPALLPSIEQHQQRYLQDLTIMRRERDQKAQTIKELQRQLSSLLEQDPSLQGRIRIYYEEQNRLETEMLQEPDNQVMNFSFIDTDLSYLGNAIENQRHLQKIKINLKQIQPHLPPLYLLQEPQSPLASSLISITFNALKSEILPRKISICLKFFTFQRGRTDWIDVNQQGQLSLIGKQVTISYKISSNIWLLKQYLKHRVLQIQIIDGSTLATMAYCFSPLQQLVKRRRNQVKLQKQLVLLGSLRGRLKVSFIHRHSDEPIQEPVKKISLVKNVSSSATQPTTINTVTLPKPVTQLSEDPQQRQRQRIKNLKIRQISARLKQNQNREQVLKKAYELSKPQKLTKITRTFILDQVTVPHVQGHPYFFTVDIFNPYTHPSSFSLLLQDPDQPLLPELSFPELQFCQNKFLGKVEGKRQASLKCVFLSQRHYSAGKTIKASLFFNAEQYIGCIHFLVLPTTTLIDFSFAFYAPQNQSFQTVLPPLSNQPFLKDHPVVLTSQKDIVVKWHSPWELLLTHSNSTQACKKTLLFFYSDQSKSKIIACWQVIINRLPYFRMELRGGTSKTIGLPLPSQLINSKILITSELATIKPRRAEPHELSRSGLGEVVVTGIKSGRGVVRVQNASTGQVVHQHLIQVKVNE